MGGKKSSILQRVNWGESTVLQATSDCIQAASLADFPQCRFLWCSEWFQILSVTQTWVESARGKAGGVEWSRECSLQFQCWALCCAGFHIRISPGVGTYIRFRVPCLSVHTSVSLVILPPQFCVLFCASLSWAIELVSRRRHWSSRRPRGRTLLPGNAVDPLRDESDPLRCLENTGGSGKRKRVSSYMKLSRDRVMIIGHHFLSLN